MSEALNGQKVQQASYWANIVFKVGTMFAAVVIAWQLTAGQVKENTEDIRALNVQVSSMNTRLISLQISMAETRRDVQWIRNKLERELK